MQQLQQSEADLQVCEDTWEELNESDYEPNDLPPPNYFTNPFKQPWQEYKSAYKGISPFKNYKTYDLKPIIVKANDDCRQEVLAIQLMYRLQKIWKQAGLSLWLKPYNIFITSANSALIEFMPDTLSVHALKKKLS